jgi:hypothetical protein
MPASRPFTCRLRLILSLIVLFANVAAPFRTPTGRALLRCPRQSDTTRSVARVRVVSHAGAFQGFRAVVGFAKGNPGEAHPSRDSQPRPMIVPSSTFNSQNRLLNLASNLPRPPLRC